MRHLFLAAPLALTLLVSLAHADDDPRNIAGYDKTIWGMSVDEVLAAESPRVEKLEKPEIFKTGISPIIINEIQIGVSKFRVLFIFNEKEQKLMQVNLAGYEQNNPGINSMAFSSIEKLLSEKYGAPTFKQEGKNVSWKLPKTVIDLTHLNIPGIVSQVTISYKPAAASGAASQDL